MTAREFLAQLKAEYTTLQLLRNELEEVDAISKSVSSLTMDDMPHGTTTPDRTGRLAARVVDLLQQIEDQERRCKAIEAETLQMIASMPRKTENECRQQGVLRLRYVNLLPWRTITRILFGNMADFDEKTESFLRRTTRLHGQALRSFETVYNKVHSTGNGPEKRKISK